MQTRFFVRLLLGVGAFFLSLTPCYAVPHFLTLPFSDSDVKIQQGWVYTFGNQTACGHKGIDYIKGTVDNSSTWKAFDVIAAADGEAVLRRSSSFGDYVTVKTVVDGVTYYTLYAHLDDTLRKLQPNVATSVSRGQLIGIAGKTGDASNNVIHLHFELSIKHFGRAVTEQQIRDCQGVNQCGDCRLDPYDIYGQRSAYPAANAASCPSGNYYWVECPPRNGATECTNGTATGFPPSGRPPVHPNGTIVKVPGNDALYLLQDGLRRFIPTRRRLNHLYLFGNSTNDFRGFDFRDVVTISPQEMDRYPEGVEVTDPLPWNGRHEPDGRLITPRSGPRRGEISIVTNNGRRRPFATLDAFNGLGYRHCNVATVDDYDFYPEGPLAEVMLVASDNLTLTPSGPYTTGQTLNAKFSIMNIGTAEVTIDTLTAGGRLNGDNSGAGGFPDFTPRSSIRLEPGKVYDYTGTLPLGRAGEYNFFMAYKDSAGYWSTTIPREPNVSTNQRITVTGTIVGGGGTDFFNPSLTITSHSDGQTVETNTITVSGTATDAGSASNGISMVKVNGLRAHADTASGADVANWSQTISLSQGANTVTVEATDGSINQNISKKILTIHYQPLIRFNITGRITDTSGNALGNVEVNYLGIRRYPDGGVRIMRLDTVFTNPDGNYTITDGFEGFTIGVTPLKQGLYFIPRFRRFENLSGNTVGNFVGKPAPPPPTIFTEENSDRAISLTSITHLRDPLPLSSVHNLGEDLRTRVVIFARGIELPPGETIEKFDVGIIGEAMEDSQTVVYSPEVEYIGNVPNTEGLTQIVFKFPDDPRLVGDVWIQINFLGVLSNKALITIRPQ